MPGRAGLLASSARRSEGRRAVREVARHRFRPYDARARTCVPARAPLVADPGRPRSAIATRKLVVLWYKHVPSQFVGTVARLGKRVNERRAGRRGCVRTGWSFGFDGLMDRAIELVAVVTWVRFRTAAVKVRALCSALHLGARPR